MKSIAGAVVAALLLMSGPVLATESVGRTSFELPESWKLVTAYESKLTFDGGAHSMPIHNALYQLLGKAFTPAALLLVSSTEGGNRNNVSWVSETCPEARPKYFTNDFDSKAVTNKRECLVINTSFAAEKFFRPDSEVVKAMSENGLLFFKSGVSVRSVMGVRGGTLVRVNFMAQRNFPGLIANAPQATELHEVAAPVVAWGEALHESVRQAAYSLNGKLELPPIQFSN